MDKKIKKLIYGKTYQELNYYLKRTIVNTDEHHGINWPYVKSRDAVIKEKAISNIIMENFSFDELNTLVLNYLGHSKEKRATIEKIIGCKVTDGAIRAAVKASWFRDKTKIPTIEEINSIKEKENLVVSQICAEMAAAGIDDLTKIKTSGRKSLPDNNDKIEHYEISDTSLSDKKAAIINAIKDDAVLAMLYDVLAEYKKQNN